MLAVSFCCCGHVVPLCANTYAAPAPTREVLAAPTKAVAPDNATAPPNLSPVAPSLAATFCCCVHTVPLCTNTYAAPMSELPPTPNAPTSAVVPDKATDPPK